MKIQLKNDQRVVIVGATGSGKTVLAKHFLERLNRVLVVDPKHTFRLDGFKIRRTLPALGQRWKMIFRPGPSDDFEMGDLFSRMFKIKNCTIYCDELATMSEKFPYATEVLADIARTGRERHVSVWTALQRPRWVPRVFFTEAESIFIFNLRGEDDRDYMSKFTDAIVKEPIEKFTFWYYHPDNPLVALMKFNILKNYIQKIG
jgi:ABC-type dipeptide/oligopeptide/nickel transport system ATPase component